MFERRADDQATGSVSDQIGNRFDGDTAADEDRCLSCSARGAVERVCVGRAAGGCSRDDDPVGVTALNHVGNLDLNGARGQRGGVLHVHVGQDANRLGLQVGSFSQQVMRDSLQQTLIGHASTAQDVDSNERRPTRHGDRQRAESIVAQHVDPERHVRRAADFARESRHRRNRDRGNTTGIERSVAEVLDHQAIDSARAERFGIAQDELTNGIQITGPTRRPRQRRQMQHADDGNTNRRPLR